MATPSLLHESPDFSLVLGGPLYQLLRRAHLTGTAAEQMERRIIVAALITWLPLAVLSLIQGAPEGAKLIFLHDIEAHVRFLIALPVLIAAEVVVHQRMRITVRRFIERGIVRSHDVPKFDSAIEAATRLRNSLPLEIGLIVLIYTVGRWVWFSRIALPAATWYGSPEGNHLQLSLPGYWYAWVSLPIFQFILLRWYLRFLNWFLFLWRVSRLDLHLLPAHPDRAGGLGFLGTGSYAFAPILFAQGTLLASFLANRIFYQGQNLLSFKPTVAGFVVFFLVVVLAPLSRFYPAYRGCETPGIGGVRDTRLHLCDGLRREMDAWRRSPRQPSRRRVTRQRRYPIVSRPRQQLQFCTGHASGSVFLAGRRSPCRCYGPPHPAFDVDHHAARRAVIQSGQSRLLSSEWIAILGLLPREL